MCMIDGGDDTWESFARIERRARVEHTCGECHRTIEPGEIYERGGGVSHEWGRGVYTSKTCAHCVAAREWLLHECRGWVWEGVREDLYEHFDGFNYTEPERLRLGRYLIGMRRKWKAFSGDGLMQEEIGRKELARQ
jgi:hypothetical protein